MPTSTNDSKIPILKAGAQVPIQVGSPFVKRVQQLLVFLRTGKTVEDLQEFKKRVDNKEALEPWMEHLITITSLLKGIEKAAIKHGLTTEEDISSIVPDVQPVPQSESQPESLK